MRIHKIRWISIVRTRKMKCKFQESIMLGKSKINYKDASRLYLTQDAKLQHTHKTSKVKYGFHFIILIYTTSSFIFKFPLLLFVSSHFISTCNSFSTFSQRGHGHLSVLSLRPSISTFPVWAMLSYSSHACYMFFLHSFFISQYATKDQFSFIFPTPICLCM